MYKLIDMERKIKWLNLAKLRDVVHWDDEQFSRELQGGP